MRRVQEQPKACLTCGKEMKRKKFTDRLEDMAIFRKRKFCSLRCANTRDDVGRQGWLWRARQLRKMECEACGWTKRLQAHHRDGNIRNISPANIQTLCIHCHKFLHDTAKRHGRMVPGSMASPALLRT